MKKLVLIAAMSGGLALAHASAEGVIKERMDAMSAIGEANKPLVSFARGRADIDLDVVKESAQTIAQHAGTRFADLFPVGSLDAPTEALPAIWEEWDRFEDLSLELERASLDLALINSADDFSDLYRNVSNTCRSCHSDFRE